MVERVWVCLSDSVELAQGARLISECLDLWIHLGKSTERKKQTMKNNKKKRRKSKRSRERERRRKRREKRNQEE